MSSKLLLRDYKTLKIMRILCQQSRQETRWTKRYIKISYILWLMRNYLKVQNQLKYRRCQTWLSTSLQLFTFSSKSSDMRTKQLQFLLMSIANIIIIIIIIITSYAPKSSKIKLSGATKPRG